MTCWMSMATKIEKRVKPQRMMTAHCWSVQVGATPPVFLTVSALLVAGVAAVAGAGEVEPLQQPVVKFAELLPRGENRLQMLKRRLFLSSATMYTVARAL